MSFVRAAAPGAPVGGPGTRPGPGGTPLISTGVSGIDSALGGGLPLGRLLLLVEEEGQGRSSSSSSSVVDTVSRLFIAEGIACGQRVAWVQSERSEEESESNELEKQRWWIPGRAVPRSEQTRTSSPSASSSKADKVDDEDALDEDDGSDLKIAWQYRRYIASARAAREEEERRKEEDERAERRRRRQQQSAGGSSSSSSSSSVKAWCHDFDLTRRTLCPGFGSAKAESSKATTTVTATTAATTLVAAESVSSAADAAVAAARASSSASDSGLSLPPARILVSDPGFPEWTARRRRSRDDEGEGEENDKNRFFLSSPAVVLLRRLRGALRGSGPRAAAVVTLRSGSLSPSEMEAARAAADAVVSFSPIKELVPSTETGNGIISSALSPSSLIAGAGPNGPAVALARVVRLPPPGPAVPSRPQPCSGVSDSRTETTSSLFSGEVLLVVSRRNRRRALTVSAATIDHDAEEALSASSGGGSGGGNAAAACGARPGSRAAASLEF